MRKSQGNVVSITVDDHVAHHRFAQAIAAEESGEIDGDYIVQTRGGQALRFPHRFGDGGGLSYRTSS